MIARVTWGKIRPGKWTDFEKMWNDYAGRARTAAGSRGRVLLRDEDTQNAGYSISFWDDNAAFEAFRAANPAPPAMQDCFVGEYITTVTQVSGATVSGLSA